MPESDAGSRLPAAPDSARRYRWVAAIVLILFFAALGVRCVKKGWYEPPDPKDTPEEARRRKYRGCDFTAYYSAGELARQGKDIYRWDLSSTPYRPFVYPPMFALFPMALLSLLPHNAALIAFYLLNVAALLATLWMLRRMLYMERRARKPAVNRPHGLSRPWLLPGVAPPGTAWWRRPEAGLALATVLCWRFMDSNFGDNNANLLILFVITAALYALHRERRVTGGLAVALATSFKLTPGLFGLYFLWSRRGWAMVGGALGLAVFLLLIPGLWLGWSYNWERLTSYAQEMGVKLGPPAKLEAAPAAAAAPALPAGETPAAPPEDSGEGEAETRAYGISLRGTLVKLLSPSVSLPRRPATEDRTINVVNLDPATAARVADALALLLLIVTVLLTASRAARQTGWGLVLSWGLVAVAMLLISPHTRKAHAVVLLIPAAALLALLAQDRLSGTVRRLAWFAVLFLGAATLLTGEGVIGVRAGEVAHAAGASTWPMVVLYVACAAALRQVTGSDSEKTGTTAGQASSGMPQDNLAQTGS